MSWIDDYDLGPLLFWLTVVSLVSVAVSAAFLPSVLANLPVDYFANTGGPPGNPRGWQPRTVRLARNALGVVLILAGILMLVIPGQGILTILVGIVLTDLPGKRRLEHWLFRLPGIRRCLDWIRRRKGAPPFE